LTGTTSAFGAELDSLADVIAFGVAPSLIIYLWRLSGPASSSGFDWWLLPVFAFAACGAIRLARFNVSDSEDGYEFTGIPMPVGALLPITACMAYHEVGLSLLGEKLVLAALLLISGLLMVSRLRVPAYKHFRNRLRQGLYYGAIAAGVTLLLFGGPGGTVLLVLLMVYLSLAIGKAVARRLSERQRSTAQ
jgi:CDP-diacylglycerol--serine O-phosphatidyltransferase